MPKVGTCGERNEETNKWIYNIILPFSLELEYDRKDGTCNHQYETRWHPNARWCMGGCLYCKRLREYFRWKGAKHTRKRNQIKFDGV